MIAADVAPIATAVPDVFVSYFRWTILITGMGALTLLASFTWTYRNFIRGYGLLILTGVICYQLSEIYRSAWALTQSPDLPLSWAGIFSLVGNLIFFVVCLEPTRRKRVRINESNERTSTLLGE